MSGGFRGTVTGVPSWQSLQLAHPLNPSHCPRSPSARRLMSRRHHLCAHLGSCPAGPRVLSKCSAVTTKMRCPLLPPRPSAWLPLCLLHFPTICRLFRNWDLAEAGMGAVSLCSQSQVRVLSQASGAGPGPRVFIKLHRRVQLSTSNAGCCHRAEQRPPPREARSHTSLHAARRSQPPPLDTHRDGEAFILQAELGVREGSVPAVQVGDLIRQVHLLEPRPLR